MSRPARAAAVLAGLLALAAAGSRAADAADATDAAADPVVLQYMEQAPMSGTGPDGQPRGQLVDHMRRLAAAGGLQLRWEPVPLKRSLLELRQNTRAHCVLGIFRNAERERFTRFSRPIWTTDPQWLVARPEIADRLRRHAHARLALADPALRLLVYDGVSYGETLDQWIRERSGPTQRLPAAHDRMLDMLARGRADFAILSEAELAGARRAGLRGAAAVELVRLPGAPPPTLRYLGCSHKVSPAWMEAFDRLAAQLPGAPTPTD